MYIIKIRTDNVSTGFYDGSTNVPTTREAAQGYSTMLAARTSYRALQVAGAVRPLTIGNTGK